MNPASPKNRTAIGTRITLIAVLPVVVAVAITMATLFLEQRRLDRVVSETVRQQARSEAAKIANSVYLLCSGSEQRNQRQLDHDLTVAHKILLSAGEINFATETETWLAINQATKESVSIALPKLRVGADWLGRVADSSVAAPIVDGITLLTGDFCTIFQRMNDRGDMLRVSTSVRKTDGTRAIGTFVPAKNADGSENNVVQTVLRGDSFRGRAFVVNEWHAAAYEPIWDAGKKRVVGMLYVGIGMNTMNREMRDAISRMVVGKTGYVYVLGAKGDERGKYLISHQGKRDGENIWEARDAAGNYFIQAVIAKGLKTEGGTVDHETYPWQSAGDPAPRVKLVAITQFAPWNWIIGAGVYEEDFAEVREQMTAAEKTMVYWVVLVAVIVASLAGVVGWLFSRSVARPITRVIEGLRNSSAQINAAADQTSTASQSLAEGSSEQAASLEEISASLEEMSGMTKRNAENAGNANDLARLARKAADTGAADMQAMSTAMHDIKTASDDIAKIIKTIDAIAFQTNILALNAAVEAARAGESGMGFAVVAEEVRSLAQRSAHAARETADKIEGAIGKTAQGVLISEKVALSLAEIVDKARRVDSLVGEVATASREQSQGVEQINTGVREMDRVVQTNAAAAEESAGAAEELNGHARMLNDAVAELQDLVGGRGARPLADLPMVRPDERTVPPQPAHLAGTRLKKPVSV